MEHVVEELVLLIPQAHAFIADVRHRLGDMQKVLEEFGRDVFIDMVVAGELERDTHQIERVHRHPAGAIGLIDVAAGRQLGAAIEDPDIIEAEEAALKNIASFGVLAVHPPGEIQGQLVEHAFEKREIAGITALFAIDLEDPPGGPGVHRRIDVAQRPLIGGHLAVGVHIPLARQQDELLLSEVRIQIGERQTVKRQIPGGVPRIFPLVRHRDDVGIVEVAPVGVASALAR